MRVIRIAGSFESPKVVVDEAERPKPNEGELSIRVCAAGLTRTELLWYPTWHEESGEPRIGAVPGHEFSGLVDGIGVGVRGFALGQEVYGMNDWNSDGAMAEYTTAPSSAVAPKPCRLTHAEAASVPIGALTAWQGLFDHGRLQPNERVLVHGGAGAVGIFAVQFARVGDARVTATASAANIDFVKGLGADDVIDYQKSRFEERGAIFDVVFDTVGGDTLDRSWGVLAPGGRLVTIVSTAESSTDPRIKEAFFIVKPSQDRLTTIAGQLDSGQLHTAVDGVFPLSSAPEAYTGAVPRRGRGKLVIDIAGE
jgi:NADPH:quinone reductase-like Zn-dependent oxidoreductase